LTIPEIVMTSRLSPAEDFRTRTLSAVSGIWSKILYLAELRSEDGRYQHWGHNRIHGESRSQDAIATIHSELYLEFLRRPISELTREPGSLPKLDAAASKINPERMIPKDLGGGSPRHFNSIVLALRFLNADRLLSRHSTASPPRPPVQ